MSDAVPMSFLPTPAPEDRARADFYALLARLFYAPPDDELLAGIACADELESEDATAGLALAWRDLKLACAASDEDAAQEEFDSVFVGVGKAEVSPYLGAYAVAAGSDNPLVELRAFLADLGLARQTSVSEPEDHVAALCEVMRHLILEHPGDLDLQRDFFANYVWPGGPAFCAAAAGSGSAVLYKAVARFALRYMELEHSAFEMQ